MNQQRRPRTSLQRAMTLGVALVVALCAIGAVRAATTKPSPTVTTKVMVDGLKAIRYPAANPKKLSCRGLGVAVEDRHTSFRCVATLKGDRERRFYTRAVAKGGWLCAGNSPSACRLLKRGFFPTSRADNQGWQQTAVLGWLQAHHIGASGAVGVAAPARGRP